MYRSYHSARRIGNHSTTRVTMLEGKLASLSVSEPADVDGDAEILERIITPRQEEFSTEARIIPHFHDLILSLHHFQECIYLGERFPTEKIHPSLLGYHRNDILPPISLRGWVITWKSFGQGLSTRASLFFLMGGSQTAQLFSLYLALCPRDLESDWN